MKKKLFCLFFICTLFVAASTSFAGIWGESVSVDDLSDGRSFNTSQYDPPDSEGGLQGNWPGDFSIQWNITQDLSTLMWTYEYTFISAQKAVSHFILELTEGEDFGEILEPRMRFGDGQWQSAPVDGPGMWDGSNGNSDPGWPDGTGMFGIKFDAGSNYVTYAFETMRDPVWGNFYVKSGKHEGEWVYAYNNALQIEDFDSREKLDFIVRPDGGDTPPVVPEPASSVLFLTGSGVFIYRRLINKG